VCILKVLSGISTYELRACRTLRSVSETVLLEYLRIKGSNQSM
jgi:hypothetical protein